MKRFLHILLLLVATATVTVAAFAFSSCSSSSAPGGKFIYRLNSDEATYRVLYKWDNKTNEIDEIKIPDTYKGKTVTELGDFYIGANASVTINRVVIPASIEVVCMSAFSDMKGLREVIFEEESKCDRIGICAFENCVSLTSINLPETVKHISNGAFKGCGSLKSFSIPSGVTYLGGESFSSCYSLKSVSIPNGVTEIADGTFQFCSSLADVTLPENLQSIGNSAFQYTAISSVSLPDTLTNIGSEAFDNCSLATIEIPSSVKEIQNFAFDDCTKLKTVTFAEGSQCETIDKWAFRGCSVLENVQLPERITSITEESFKNCKALTDITIPDSVERIEKNAFENCEGLSAIRFGKNSKCTYFGDKAFYRCKNLKKVYIGNVTAWLQTIFDGSYWNPLENDADKILLNDSNTELVVPAEVETIPYRAFANCSELERVTFEDGSKCKSIGASAFV